MEKVWRVLRQAWWLVVGVVAAALGVVALVVFRRPEEHAGADMQYPEQRTDKPLRERAREEVERVRLEGEMEKAEKAAVMQVQRAQLRQIKQTAQKNPVAARQQLADWLRKNL